MCYYIILITHHKIENTRITHRSLRVSEFCERSNLSQGHISEKHSDNIINLPGKRGLLRQRPPRNDNLLAAFIMCLGDHCSTFHLGDYSHIIAYCRFQWIMTLYRSQTTSHSPLLRCYSFLFVFFNKRIISLPKPSMASSNSLVYFFNRPGLISGANHRTILFFA